MSVEIELIYGLASGAITGAIAAVVSKMAKQLKENKLAQAKSDIQKTKMEFGINIAGIELRHQVEDQAASEPLTEKLISQVEDGLYERLADLDGMSKERVREEIDKKVIDIRTRLEQIEGRFPDTNTIDKISSINDALFAERIELLAKRLDSLEAKQLGKWDVAIVVSLVISGISVVVGATYSVITVLSGTGS